MGWKSVATVEGYGIVGWKLFFLRILKAFFTILFEVWILSHFWLFVWWGLLFALWKLKESFFFLKNPIVLKFHSVCVDVGVFSSVISGTPQALSSLAFCS